MPERRCARAAHAWNGTSAARSLCPFAGSIVRLLAAATLVCTALSAHAASGTFAAHAPLVPIPASQASAANPHLHGARAAHGAPGVQQPRPPHMPFYVATKDETTIYLFGTLHIGDPADYPPDQPFRQPIIDALSASSKVAFELSPDDMIVSQDDVTRYGVCSHPCLPRLLPPALWAKIARRMHGNPAGLAAIRKTRPWLAAMLVETYDALAAGLQAEYGSESQIENVYIGRIVGLETLDEQMDAFTGLSLAEQREMLAQDLVQRPAQNVADVQVLHTLWRAGDADAMAGWQARKSGRLARSPQLSERIDERVVYQRSKRFAVRALLLAGPNEPVFIAIGALHLGGPKGVLALLREHGFEVEAR